jgi:hypothetical protein
MDYGSDLQGKQASDAVARSFGKRLEAYVRPLLIELDKSLDKRLVRTFLKTLQVIVQFRHRAQGLLLSELGAYILSPDHAPAGTKRLSNLLRSQKWVSKQIEQCLWKDAHETLNELGAEGDDPLLAWDESVLEKSENIAIEGLCSVRSSRARRLKRIKPGYFNPPGGRPIMVPGMHWVALLLMGRRGVPKVAAMHWWTTRGKFASDRRSVEEQLLAHCAQAWGQRVIHIWDRGFSGGPWLAQASQHDVRFVLRWQKGYKLLDSQGRYVYAFLLSLLAPQLEALCQWLLRFWCHRTGKRHREVSMSLYRLRSALSRLWLEFPPPRLSPF